MEVADNDFISVKARTREDHHYLEKLSHSGKKCTASRGCSLLHQYAAFVCNRLNNNLLDEVCLYDIPVHDIVHLYNAIIFNIELFKTRSDDLYFVKDHDKECTCWWIFFTHLMKDKMDLNNPLMECIAKYLTPDDWDNMMTTALKFSEENPDSKEKLTPFFEKMFRANADNYFEYILKKD